MTRRAPASAAVSAFALVVATLAGRGGGAAVPTLNWYINPDNGGQADLAAKCSAATGGRYRLVTSVLPNEATGQREQLVRRLAAKDVSIDLMSLDPPFVAEFAAAGFLRPFAEAEAEGVTEGVLDGPVESARWDGKLVSVPFWANSQLLWYRKSVVARAGLDPAGDGVVPQPHGLLPDVGVVGGPGAGGGVVDGLPDEVGHGEHRAARVAFQGTRGGFMVNWPYIYGAVQEAAADGSLDRAVLDDIGWARYPQALTARLMPRTPASP